MDYKQNDIGYVLDLDFEYPKEIHDLTNDYPLCVERINTSKL